MNIEEQEPQRSSRECVITITIDDAGDRTRAIARMDWRGRSLVGIGHTRSGEQYPDRLSENLSVSRALSDIVARLDTLSEGAVQTSANQSAPAP